MTNKVLKLCARTGLLFLETCAVILLLFIIAAAFLFWRVTAAPLSLDFAINYIEEAVNAEDSPYHIDVKGVSLNWKEIASPLQLTLNNVSVHQDNETLIRIDEADVKLSPKGLIVGQFKPTEISISGPSLRVIRDQDNGFALSMQNSKSIASDNTLPEPGTSDTSLMDIIDLLGTPEEDLDQSSPLQKLQSVTITNARVIIEDYALGITWFLPDMDLGLARVDKGLEANATVSMKTGVNTETDIALSAYFNRDLEEFAIALRMQNFDPAFLAERIDAIPVLDDQNIIINVNAQTILSNNFDVLRAELDVHSAAGMLRIEKAYDRPLNYENMQLSALYDRTENTIDLKTLSADIAGVYVTIESKIKTNEDFTKFETSPSLHIPRLTGKDIENLWPKFLRGEGAEEWLVGNLKEGSLTNLQLTLDASAAQSSETWSFDTQNIQGAFDTEDVYLQYHETLLPATKGQASATYIDDNLTFDLKSAYMGGLALSEGKIIINNVSDAKNGNVDIKARVNGPVTALFDFIQKEPIGVNASDLGLKLDQVKGQTDFDLSVTFPLEKEVLEENLIVKANGHLLDVALPGIIKDMTLSGKKLALQIEGGAAIMEGNGKLDGRDVKFRWQQFVNPDEHPFASHITAKLVADDSLRQSFGVDIEEWVRGPMALDIDYKEFSSGYSQLTFESDITESILEISPFEYIKSPGNTGHVKGLVQFGPESRLQEVRDLKIETEDLNLDNGKLEFVDYHDEPFLHAGEIPVFRLGENDIAMIFQREQSELLKMEVSGAFLDARPFLEDGNSQKTQEPYDEPPLQISVNVDRMRTHPARLIENVGAYIHLNDKGQPLQLELDAKAGNGDIYFRFKPNDKGIMTIRLEADGAGATLKAFNVYESIKGGELVIYGEANSPGTPFILYGNMQITDFRVSDAPILAQVVNAMSLTSIPQLLNNEGITFSRLEAGFDWSLRPGGDLFVLKEGRTSGSSLGLTFEGVVDKDKDRIDIVGTVVPVSTVNRMFSSIPLIGDILAGGRDGAIFAATYSVKGASASPTVTVNPLAALTPGILRKIFFENDAVPEDTAKENVQPNPELQKRERESNN